MKTQWQEFYSSVRDPSWPECDSEKEFVSLPQWIQDECVKHGYEFGQYQTQSLFLHRRFPIKTSTACQLKWNWSTIFLSTEETASCHRTHHHKFNASLFDFHNTPEKIEDRKRMLQGLWPNRGCDYCRDIENAGGQSDRITNLDFPGIYSPVELETDQSATRVTPRILEVYFDNLCNLKCVYCGPHFSSLWDAENKQHGTFRKNGLVIQSSFKKSDNIDHNVRKLFEWMLEHGKDLTNFNILGGEPLYQKQLDQCLDFFDEHPYPDLDLQIFTNLHGKIDRIQSVVSNINRLIRKEHIRRVSITASIDCWGAPQEYARFPLDLAQWEKNFLYLLEQDWINLIIGSTITPLTLPTLPDLVGRINQWNQRHPVQHYFNSVNGPSYMFIDIFGDLFKKDFDRVLAIMPEDTPDQRSIKKYLEGISMQSFSKGINRSEVLKLHTFLEEMDHRRGTNWPMTFPWLVPAFESIIGK